MLRSFAAVLLAPVVSLSAQGVRSTLALDGLWQLRVVNGANAPVEDGWRDVYVPSAFESVLGHEFDGIVEYRKTLDLAPPRARERVFVRFGAVMTHARVLFNGVEVGKHLGGWTPFRCALPASEFRDGEQELRVVVGERVGHNTQGFLPAIQRHFGGIWQSVELQRYRGEGFDPDLVEVRAFREDGKASLRVRFDVFSRGVVVLRLFDGGDVVARRSWPVATAPGDDVPFVEEGVTLEGIEPWSPSRPKTYRVELTVRPSRDAPVADRVEREIAFREVRASGRSILLNGEFLHVRGVLHWGYGPPTLEPNPPESVWRDEMRWAKACGFNMIKACLWVPPPSFFAVAQQEGMLVWQEYPTWHPDLSEKHRAALVREYDEFFALDRSRAPIVVRSLTCETGRAAARETVVKELFERCKKATGAALVEDDSSWITWNRFHDFYDDHPYGNCGPWVGRLRGFDEYIDKNGPKPFLLGEAIAADTWMELDAVETLLAGGSPWWRPFAMDSMRAFERWVAAELGAGAVARLVPDSKHYAMQARKYQIEAFRRVLPDAGYVTSVIRDFPRARMGYFDDAGRPKWGTADFAWHGEHMVVLDDPRAVRSLAGEALPVFRPRVRVTGRDVHRFGKLAVTCSTRLEVWKGGAWRREVGGGDAFFKLALEQDGPLLSRPLELGGTWDGIVPQGNGLRRARIRVDVDGVANNEWTFYGLPKVADTFEAGPPKVSDTLTPELLDWVTGGGRLLLLAGGKGGLKSQGLWFLQGAPFAAETHALFATVPRDVLLDLQQLDLDGLLFRLTPLAKAFDVVLGFWDSHDEHQDVQELAFLLEARVGNGRVLACSLGLDLRIEPAFDDAGAAGPNPARAWLRGKLLYHLANGPAPRKALPDALLAQWRAALTSERIELGGVWLLQPDGDDAGLAGGWAEHGFDDSGWIRSQAGRHWEAAGLPHHDGIAWYRKRFTPPASWRPGQPLYAIFDGVDDSYALFVNGERVAAFGDPATKETVWLIRTHADIARFAKAGENLLALRVVDHQGAGGLHRKVWLSTAPPESDDFVNR